MRKRKKKIPQEEMMTGILRMHPKGFGFVIPDNPSIEPQDVFIPKHLTAHAVDGDHVEVAINRSVFSEKGPEGKITTILKRARKHIAGIIRQILPGEITAFCPLLGASKPVKITPDTETTVNIGDRVCLEVISWGTEKTPTFGKITEIIGNINDPSCDIPAAIEEFNLSSTFPKNVIAQAKAFAKKVPKKDLASRMDLTGLETFTIDPDTAKDFDDALSLSLDKEGNYHLAVHIADVAHYVKPETPLDIEAASRSNSTYFPGTCVPMLPEELSNELCSLKEGVIRLTVSVLIAFNYRGEVLKQSVVRSFIKSQKRFTYFEAKDVLDGKKKSRHAPTLHLMVKLCHLLKIQRHTRGSIDFSLPEVVLLVDPQGVPTGFKHIPYDITHQLVEEFMLKANEVVAKELTARGKDLIFRIHESPSKENFEDFFNLARSFGFFLPASPESKDLQNLFAAAKNTPFIGQLSVAFIRSMKLAQYSPDNIGHFGLALEHYCHFTSPIRRYSDLIIERLLFNEEPEEIDLEATALRCSEQERISFKAEMSVKTLKKLRLLKSYFEKEPNRIYNATVSKIKSFGIYLEVSDVYLEGFLHISELDNDYFIFNPERNILVGKSTGKTYSIGEALQVTLEAIDLIGLESKWQLVTAHKRTSQTSKRRKRR